MKLLLRPRRYLDVGSACPGDQGPLGVEAVEAQRELHLLVQQDEYLDSFRLQNICGERQKDFRETRSYNSTLR